MVCLDKCLASVSLSSACCSVWGELSGLGAFCMHYAHSLLTSTVVGLRLWEDMPLPLPFGICLWTSCPWVCLVSYWRCHECLVDPELLHTRMVPARVLWSFFDFGDLHYLWRLILRLIFSAFLFFESYVLDRHRSYFHPLENNIFCLLWNLGCMSWIFQRPN